MKFQTNQHLRALLTFITSSLINIHNNPDINMNLDFYQTMPTATPDLGLHSCLIRRTMLHPHYIWYAMDGERIVQP